MSSQNLSLNLASPPVEVNIQFRNGGLGDHICRLPAVKALLDRAPNLKKVNLICPDFFVELGEHLLQDYKERVNFWPVTEFIKAPNSGIPALITDETHHSTLRTHLVDHAFHVLGDFVPEIDEMNYLQLRLDQIDISQLQLPPEYVVVTTGFTARVRQWLPSQINAVVNYIRSIGLRVVFLGKEHVDEHLTGNFRHDAVKFSLGINLINKTTLLEAGKILANARSVIGLDNGLLHLAACSDVPIVAGYSSVAPEFRLPYRHSVLGWNCEVVEPDADLGCRFCQSSCYLNFQQDFRECFYGNYLCLVQMKAEKWIAALDRSLNGRAKSGDTTATNKP